MTQILRQGVDNVDTRARIEIQKEIFSLFLARVSALPHALRRRCRQLRKDLVLQ